MDYLTASFISIRLILRKRRLPHLSLVTNSETPERVGGGAGGKREIAGHPVFYADFLQDMGVGVTWALASPGSATVPVLLKVTLSLLNKPEVLLKLQIIITFI